MEQLKATRDVILCGDGRFDSMGHSAKYGVYTMQSTSLMKIVHFELVQVSIIIGYSSVKYKIL
jgi:solute carrier family 8 (sodium/calcium exchanger)